MRRTLMCCLVLALSGVAAADPATTALWRQRCAPCHGADGRGYNQRAQRMAMGDMTTEAWQIEMTDARIRDTVRHGLRRVKLGNQQVMKHFKDKLTAAQIERLIEHVRGLARGAAPRARWWWFGW